MSDREPDSITLQDVQDARKRLDGIVPRTPLIRLDDGGAGELYLKLENLQPIRSFKVRGAANAISMLDDGSLQAGVYTASAGNMAQGVAWNARRLGVRCTAVVPQGAPHSKLEAIQRLGAETIALPYDDWWNVLVEHRYAPLEPASFIHPVSDVDVMAGNGTIGLEILEDLPDVNTVLVPFGGGGLSCGIATAKASVRRCAYSGARWRRRRPSPPHLPRAARCRFRALLRSWTASAARLCCLRCGRPRHDCSRGHWS